VVDSGSSDDTVAIARAAGARVVETDWPGHVAQKNRAFALARGEWVLSIDADERVSPALRDAIVRALAEPCCPDGFRVARLNCWLGHPLRHGHWYPDRRVRLARRERARWSGEDLHDILEVEGPVREIAGDIEHTPYRNLGEHLATIDRYSAIGAVSARSAGRRATLLDLAFRPFWHFFSGYVLRLGVLDGLPGLTVASLGALQTYLKWSRLRGAIP
jgi:glycosyltransferase involved in cell wall biosynthesis